MRRSPSNVPLGNDQEIYLVLDHFGEGEHGARLRSSTPISKHSSRTYSMGSIAIRFASSPSIPPRAGGGMSQRTWPTRCADGAEQARDFPSSLEEFGHRYHGYYRAVSCRFCSPAAQQSRSGRTSLSFLGARALSIARSASATASALVAAWPVTVCPIGMQTSPAA